MLKLAIRLRKHVKSRLLYTIEGNVMLLIIDVNLTCK